jgi:hypothetical protein
MQASWAVGVGKGEVWACCGLLFSLPDWLGVKGLWGALKASQTVLLRSLPLARLAAGTLAFHGLIRSRLGRPRHSSAGLSDPCVDTTMR